MTTGITLHGTTIISVRKNNEVIVAGDGQITLGHIILKPNARKIRRLANGNVIVGFAGATADALTLFERLETKLELYPLQLQRACVELAKEWRTDKYLRKLEAMMIVADEKITLVLTGTGDVLEPEENMIGIGSGGAYALAAAKALFPIDNMSAEDIARRSLHIAAELCIYTNNNITLEKLG